MAGLPWIPLDVEFPTSRKAIALGIAVQNPLAWAHVVRLWCWAGRNAPEGRIEGPDAMAVIEHAAGWDGPPGDLVEAMCLPHIRLLDQHDPGFSIHDWEEHCGAHVEKRRKERERVREHRRTVRVRYANGTSTYGVRTGEQEQEQEQGSNVLLPSTVTEQPPARKEGKTLKDGLYEDFQRRIEEGLGHSLIPLQKPKAAVLEAILQRDGTENCYQFVAATCRNQPDANPKSMAWVLTVLERRGSA